MPTAMIMFGVPNHMYVRHVLNVGARLATLASALCANTLQDYKLFACGLNRPLPPLASWFPLLRTQAHAQHNSFLPSMQYKHKS